MTWLNVKGHREFQLDRTMKLWWDYIVPGMKKRQLVSIIPRCHLILLVETDASFVFLGSRCWP